MENGLSLCSSDSDGVLFPNIIHFEPDINVFLRFSIHTSPDGKWPQSVFQ